MAKAQQMDPKTELRFFGYEIDADLYKDLTTNLEKIRIGGRSEELSTLAAQDLVRVTHVGLEAYYQRPADLIELSPLVRKAADAGISGVFKAVDMVIHKVLAKRSLEELQTMARDMSQMVCVSGDIEPRYFICFPLPAELFERSQTLISRVQHDSNVELYRQDIIHSLEDLIEEAINVYYTGPTSKVQVGRFTKAAADMGMTTVKKGSSMVLHKVFKAMPHEELLPLADYFLTLLHDNVNPYAALNQSRV